MSKGFPPRFAIALGLLSASVIATQLAFMHVLSSVQWHHFAYMVISIAMLGFGAAGTVISLFKNRLLLHKDILIPIFGIAAGISVELALRLTNTEMLAFDLYHLFIDTAQFWKLALNLVFYFLPFFFAALVIGISFSAWVSEIGKLYFANLVGSGLGALLALVLLSNMYPWHAASFCALSAMFAGLLMIRHEKSITIFILVGIVVISGFTAWLLPFELRPSQYKGLSKMLNMPHTEVVYQEPGIYGLNQVVSSPYMRYAPGISLRFDQNIQATPAFYTNAEFTGVLINDWKNEPHPSEYTTFTLPFEIHQPDSILVINAGTGYFVAHALHKGVSHVDATEPNRALVQMMQSVLLNLTDSLYQDERVNIYTIESRALLASSKHKYDLIFLPVMDAFGGTSGLHAMQENYTLTIEGFEQAWKKLKPDGLLSISSWLDYPLRTPLKITTTLVEMLKRQNVNDPAEHIALIKSWGTVTFVLSKSPLSDGQVKATRAFCDSMYFDPVLLPGISVEERNRYNMYSDPSLFNMLDNIMSGSKEYSDYAFHIVPATDNRPYFSQFMRLRSYPTLSDLYNQQALPFLELGYLIVFITLLQVSFMALLLIIIPLIRLKTQAKSKSPTLIYFAALGLGYMFIEIILIQRFIHYFGTPVIAAAVVISIMMVASGGGSYFSGSLKADRRTLRLALALIMVCGVLLLAGLNPLINATAGSNIYVKSLLSIITIAVPAFLMGIPFPLGLRTTSVFRESLVPWAWGVNGCLSVIASPLAILIAVEAGFSWVMFAAVMVYSLALISAGKILKPA
jgi:spermidine synthase